MRIQHNISALNAANKLKANNDAISKNIAKLSSGYRINSAADDAAGLAVSEKMRSQINGLTQAEDNAQNGISLVQTAEGGLNETSTILQRMNTLAVESANGTYQDATDRTNLQKEVTALKSEVDRISTSTNFNQINLLDGSLSAKGATSAAATAAEVTGLTAAATHAASNNDATGTVAVAADVAANKATSYDVTYKTADGTAKTVSVNMSIDGTGKNITLSDGSTIAGTSAVAGHIGEVTADDLAGALKSELAKNSDFHAAFTGAATGNAGELKFTATAAGTSGATLIGISKNGSGLTTTPTVGANAYKDYDLTTPAAYDGTNASSSVFSVNGKKFAFVKSGTDTSALGSDVNTVFVTGANAAAGAEVTSMSALINDKTGLATTVAADNKTVSFKPSTTARATAGSGVSFQIGSDNKADQVVSLNLSDMSSKGLGIDAVSVATQKDAKAAIDTIKAAINTVSGTRADLGALQNRLEHTSNNLSTMSENLTSAEANIRDVDMSSEYVQYSKNQILSQAATSMLAQANSQPQSVLTLLKG